MCPSILASNPEATSLSQTTQDPAVTALRVAREDAHRRGFHTLTLKPESKDPDYAYSPHAVKSATGDLADALRPYDNGVAANFAIAPGVTGHTFVDVDKGIQNDKELLAWMQRNQIPPTLTVRTGRDSSAGYHLIYSGAVKTHPFELDSVTGEVRSIGAYCVAPGSVHPDSHRRYEWHPLFRDVPIAPLPEIFKSQRKSEKSVTISALIPESQRNPTITSLAGHLRNFKGGVLPDSVMYELLKAFAIYGCDDGENYAAANDSKIKSLADRAVKDFDVADSFQSKAKGHAELIAAEKADAELSHIVQNTLRRKTVNIAVGDSGLGKTPFFYQMALCVAFGRDFIGYPTGRGRVLVVDYENPFVAQMIETLAQFLGIPTPVDPEYFRVLQTPSKREEVTAAIEQFKPTLVIIDSLRGYDSKAEANPEAAGEMIAKCQKISRDNECSWLFIHHLRKQDKTQKAERPDLFNQDKRVLEWLEEASGHRALVNQTFTRLGFDKPKTDTGKHKHAELGLRGFVKGQGEIGPTFLRRKYDDAGEPVGYLRVTGADLLSDKNRGYLMMIPVGVALTFAGVVKTLFDGDEKRKKEVSEFLRQGVEAGVLVPAGKDRTPSKTYTRTENL